MKQNNYIEYSLLTKQLFIAKPEETLKQMFKDNVIMLDDCAFLKDNLEELKEQILNLLVEEGIFNKLCNKLTLNYCFIQIICKRLH